MQDMFEKSLGEIEMQILRSSTVGQQDTDDDSSKWGSWSSSNPSDLHAGECLNSQPSYLDTAIMHSLYLTAVSHSGSISF